MLKKKPLVPTLSETWLRGMSVGGSLRRVQNQTYPHEITPLGCQQRDWAGRLIHGTV